MEGFTEENLEHNLRLIVPVIVRQRFKFVQPRNPKTWDKKKNGTFNALGSIAEDIKDALMGVFRGATYSGDKHTQVKMAVHDVVKKWKQYGSLNGGEKHTEEEEGYLEAIGWVFSHKFAWLAEIQTK
jgi:hypothetical protein